MLLEKVAIAPIRTARMSTGDSASLVRHVGGLVSRVTASRQAEKKQHECEDGWHQNILYILKVSLPVVGGHAQQSSDCMHHSLLAYSTVLCFGELEL